MALGIAVVDHAGGGSIGHVRAFVRYVMRIPSAFVLLLGYLWMLWDKERTDMARQGRQLDRRARQPVAVWAGLALAAGAPARRGLRRRTTGRPSAPATKPIVRSLQAGGLTLLMRHALSDAAVNQRELLRSCATQRNLTVAGREQARAIGRAIRTLRIPIGEVRASPMCRTRDTARLAFGRATLDRMLVNNGIVGSLADDRRRGRALRAFVRRPPRRARTPSS